MLCNYDTGEYFFLVPHSDENGVSVSPFGINLLGVWSIYTLSYLSHLFQSLLRVFIIISTVFYQVPFRMYWNDENIFFFSMLISELR